VIRAIFYNFADGEVARHIPRVWDTATPEAALADCESAFGGRRPGVIDGPPPRRLRNSGRRLWSHAGLS
jgi:hypothetical protein